MAIKELKSSYRVTVISTEPIQGTKRWRRSFKILKDAQLWEAESSVDILKGRTPKLGAASKAQVRTLRDLRNEVFEMRWQGTKAEDSQLQYTKFIMDTFSPSKLITDIDQACVDILVRKCKSMGNGNATINRKLTALSVMLKFAVERGYITSIPVIKKMRENNELHVWFTEEEKSKMVTILNNNGKAHISNLILFLCDTGLRVSEALRLKWEDCINGNITVWKSKTDKPRTIPQTQQVMDILETLPKDVRGPFYEISYAETRHAWDKMRKAVGKADVDGWTIHGCRHTFCSNLVQQNVPIQVVASLAGHSDIRMTMRYAHLNTSVLEEAIQKLNERD